jgi:hypothetical protein
MKFEITPDEAQKPAEAVIKYFKKKKMKIKVEQAGTVLAEKAGRKVLVEAQGTLSYGRSLQDLAAWLAANRHYAELYVATMTDSVLEVGVLHQMKMDGVGLLIVTDGDIITEHLRAKNPALVITPDPTLSLGASKTETRAAIQKFNETDRKDGLRDMCEIVERLTEELGVSASRKGYLKIPEGPFKAKDWAGQINELARNDAYNAPHVPVIGALLKDDLHSFRGGRNLIDHKARSYREEQRRQKQFADRMMQGPRLVAELIAIRRRVK